jgi:hypothetical protein
MHRWSPGIKATCDLQPRKNAVKQRNEPSNKPSNEPSDEPSKNQAFFPWPAIQTWGSPIPAAQAARRAPSAAAGAMLVILPDGLAAWYDKCCGDIVTI